MAEFDLNVALKAYLDDPQTILTAEADQALVDCESDPDAYTPGLINSVLNDIASAIGETPEAITQTSAQDSIQFLLKCANPISCTPVEAYTDAFADKLRTFPQPRWAE